MDSKAAAKSKRAHTLQHKRASQKPRPQDGSTGPKGSLKQNKGKTHHSQHPPPPSLPSNWDRYGEGLGSILEDVAAQDASAAPPSEAVEPKSKGADFAFLISEAQDELRTRPYAATESYVLTDFDRGLSSIVSVRGKSLLSWTTDDNFIVEDNSTPTHEPSFLSMDLNALAAHLEKIDVSQRLFIEPYLVPEEQGQEDVETCATSKGEDAVDPSASIGKPTTSVDASESYRLIPSTVGACDSSQDVTQLQEGSSSFDFSGSVPTLGPSQNCSNREEIAIAVVKPDVEENKTSGFQATTAEAQLDMLLDSLGVAENKAPGFDATTSEAELDILLNSFGETKLLGSFDPDEGQKQPALSQVEKPHENVSSALSKPLDDFDSWLDSI